MSVQLGIDSLIASKFAALYGQRVGLLTNPGGVNRQLQETLMLLHESDAVNLVALYSPEHGLAAVAADGAAVSDSREPRTGLPVHSLYGDFMRPTAQMLADVDVVVVDIQDVGVRFYTYLWTLSYMLEACGEEGVRVVILDRPNPLGGEVVRGAVLGAEFDTLVGRKPIPIQHGMTLGELAKMYNALWNPTPCELTVIACEGWRRADLWNQTGLTWVPTSPAMPHFSTVLHYPGACFLEGTNFSEGRGTALPFEVTGAPFMDGYAIAAWLNLLALPGVTFRPHHFTPTASKFAGEVCSGLQAHITDPAAYDPLSVWVHVLAVLWKMQPDHAEWRPHHFDRLCGDAHARTEIERGQVDGLLRRWAAQSTEFRAQRAPYLLYD